MTEYDNTNSGALFRNDEKKTENHPDYRGSLNVGGQDFWISAWLKTSKKGQKFMSLSVTPKQQASSKVNQGRETAPVEDDPFGDSIPF